MKLESCPVGYEEYGSLLRRCREAADLTLPEVGSVIGIAGQTLGSWERGRLKTCPDPDDVNKLGAFFRNKGVQVTTLEFVAALGFAVATEGMTEEDALLVAAYQSASDDERRLARLSLGVEPPTGQRGRGN